MPRFEYCQQLPYPPEPLFDLVADVERYPEFLPGWREARVTGRNDNVLTVEQTLGDWGLKWRFRTTATLERPHRITIETGDHPFEHLQEVWRFTPLEDGRTLVTFKADYALRDIPLRRLAGLVMERGFEQTLHAFEKRARETIG